MPSMLVLSIAMVIIGVASIALFRTRPPNRIQVYAAIGSLITCIVLLASPRNQGTTLFYIGALLSPLATGLLIAAASQRVQAGE